MSLNGINILLKCGICLVRLTFQMLNILNFKTGVVQLKNLKFQVEQENQFYSLGNTNFYQTTANAPRLTGARTNVDLASDDQEATNTKPVTEASGARHARDDSNIRRWLLD